MLREVKKLNTKLTTSIRLFFAPMLHTSLFPFLYHLSCSPFPPPTSCRLKLALIVLHVFPKVWKKSNMLFNGIFGICSTAFHSNATKPVVCVHMCACTCQYLDNKERILLSSEVICRLSFDNTPLT